MGADVIILPVIRIEREVSGKTVVMCVRLPSRVYNRLTAIADQWNIMPVAAAEHLLVVAINKAAGVKP
jgi:hypothetical protein